VPTPPAGQQAPALPLACYHCGEPGHYANACPRKVQSGPQGRPAQPRVPSQGRVNHVTAESAAEAPNVVITQFFSILVLRICLLLSHLLTNIVYRYPI
jgi:hypothetical protein